MPDGHALRVCGEALHAMSTLRVFRHLPTSSSPRIWASTGSSKRTTRWLWRAANSNSLSIISTATTRILSFGVPVHFGSLDARVVRGTVLHCAYSEIEQGGNRKLGAEMEVHVDNTSLGALTNGSAPAVEDGNQKQGPKLLTLVIIMKDGKVLLGMKKRGFGAGYFNGFGGKVEANETIYEAAVRELQEESGVAPLSMEKRGILTFHFDDNPQPWEVHVYHVGDYAGEPCETEEMAPRWFSLADIPYDKMWQDDPIWYPEFLHGRHFKGDFYFHNTHTLVSHTLHVLQKLDA